MSQTVEHLDSSLRVAHVPHLLHRGRHFYELDCSSDVVETHLGPREVPVLFGVLDGVESGVGRIEGASVVAEPDIVADVENVPRQLVIEPIICCTATAWHQ